MTIPLTDIRIATPWYLVLFAAIVLLALWRWKRPRQQPAVLFSILRLARAASRPGMANLRKVLPAMRYIALALLVMALARPQFGWRERQISSYGVDIMLAIDISNSMQARDFSPNRLEAAKEVVLKFLDKRESDRIGVVIFGDAPFTLCPLTLDYDAIKSFVARLTLERLGQQNTALGKGLATAANRLKDSTAKSKVVILLTDGVDTVGGIDPLTAAKAAKGLGVRVYTIGVGSTRGGESMQSVFGALMQRPGMEFDEKLLRQIAQETTGKYYHAQDEKELATIYDEINRLEKTKSESNDFMHYEERMAFVAIPALLLLLLEILLGNTLLLKIP